MSRHSQVCLTLVFVFCSLARAYTHTEPRRTLAHVLVESLGAAHTHKCALFTEAVNVAAAAYLWIPFLFLLFAMLNECLHVQAKSDETTFARAIRASQNLNLKYRSASATEQSLAGTSFLDC